MTSYDNRKELLKMIRKFLAGTATEKEETFLKSYYDFFARREYFTNAARRTKAVNWRPDESRDRQRVDHAEQHRVRPLWPKIAAAASVIFILSSGQQVSGAQTQIFIRGQNSLMQGSEPLFVVDDVPYNSSTYATGAIEGSSGDSFLNLSDIQSIDVLKNADATAIMDQEEQMNNHYYKERSGWKNAIQFQYEKWH